MATSGTEPTGKALWLQKSGKSNPFQVMQHDWPGNIRRLAESSMKTGGWEVCLLGNKFLYRRSLNKLISTHQIFIDRSLVDGKV